MINHRIATTEVCSNMFWEDSLEGFRSHFNPFMQQINAMAEKRQYTMISHALEIFDRELIDSSSTDEQSALIAASVPISLAAAEKMLDRIGYDTARLLAENIAKNQTFRPEKDGWLFIETVVERFVACGFSDHVGIILESYLSLPDGHDPYDYEGFINTLYDVFDQGYSGVINWVVEHESRLTNPEFMEALSSYANQKIGNLLYKKGLKILGSFIMIETPSSSEGVELHERRLITGREVSPEDCGGVGSGALACYLLGLPYISMDWFESEIPELTGNSIHYAHKQLSAIHPIDQGNVEVVSAIALSSATKKEKIVDIMHTLRRLGVGLHDELSALAFTKCVKNFLDSPESIIDIMKAADSFGVEIDFSPHLAPITETIDEWPEKHPLVIGRILNCYFNSRCGFPIDKHHAAMAINNNWDSWKDKDREVALAQIPTEIIPLLDRQIKGLKVTRDLGM